LSHIRISFLKRYSENKQQIHGLDNLASMAKKLALRAKHIAQKINKVETTKK
jgi:hypothetical protein